MTYAALDFRSEAFAFAEEVDRVSDPDEIVRRMRRVIDKSGLQSLTLGRLPGLNQQYESLRLVNILPAQWVREYSQRRYIDVDPVIRRLMRSAMPFEYNADYDPGIEAPAREVMARRREFGLLGGFVIPVPRRNGNGYVWMSGERPDFVPGAKPALHLMALYAFDRISGLLEPGSPRRRRLTEREREVLTWVAAGKSAWEIGEILSIAKRTVDEHTQTATRKLGAGNRTQAVAIAFRDRVIAI